MRWFLFYSILTYGFFFASFGNICFDFVQILWINNNDNIIIVIISSSSNINRDREDSEKCICAVRMIFVESEMCRNAFISNDFTSTQCSGAEADFLFWLNAKAIFNWFFRLMVRIFPPRLQKTVPREWENDREESESKMVDECLPRVLLCCVCVCIWERKKYPVLLCLNNVMKMVMTFDMYHKKSMFAVGVILL